MLHESSISPGPRVQANAGLTAFHVAVAQVKVFEKTIAEVADRQEQVVDAQARKGEELRQKIRQQVAEARGGADVLVEGSENAPANAPAQDSAPEANANAPGNKVNLEV